MTHSVETQTVSREKMRKKHLCTKEYVRKMLLKLTPLSRSQI